MRFITEFESEVPYDERPEILAFRKSKREIELAEMISKSFGFENPVNGNKLHYRLEIEAFPMEKWGEFKKRLLGHLQVSIQNNIIPNEKYLLGLIETLESFGKPETKQV